MTPAERFEAIKELPFILSGEYRPDCGCEHCVGIKKHIASALLALKVYRTEEEILKILWQHTEYKGKDKDGNEYTMIVGSQESLAQALTEERRER